MSKKITVNFDMDGTIANLYARSTWLEELRTYNPTPYEVAEVMLNMALLARRIHQLQAKGVEVNVISWLSKETTPEYDELVTEAKIKWLRKHLPSVEFDNVYIVPYGTPKESLVKGEYNVLFDDTKTVREDWGKGAYTPEEIFETIKTILER